jgi:hypothetical protein
MKMLKVVATSRNKVLVVLPYTSAGGYGSWELPRSVASSAKEVVKRAIDYDGRITEMETFTQSSPWNGEVSNVVRAVLHEVDDSKFHCNIDVRNADFPKMVFPAYVQMQFVSPTKACRLLKKSYAAIVRQAFNLPEDEEK